MSSLPAPSVSRPSPWVLVTTVGLVTLVVGGLVVWGLVVLGTGLVDSFRGESPAPYQKLVDSAPVPPGAVRTQHQASTGFDSGPYAATTYRLEAGTTVDGACPSLVASLQAAGWSPVATRWAAVCRHPHTAGVGFTTSPRGSNDDVRVSLTPSSRGVELSYSAS